MIQETEYSNKIEKIKENAKYLKLAYSFHNASELIEEHTTLNSSIIELYNSSVKTFNSLIGKNTHKLSSSVLIKTN